MDYFIDTNIFLRFFLKENEKTLRETKKVINLIKKNVIKAITSHLVIAELDWTMKSYYRISKEQRIIFLNSLLQLKNLSLKDDFNLATTLNFYKNSSVKFIDCLFASSPRLLSGKTVIISYDKEFDKLKVKRLDPKALSRYFSASSWIILQRR